MVIGMQTMVGSIAKRLACGLEDLLSKICYKVTMLVLLLPFKGILF